jgi:hypothetical protein
MKTLKVLKQRLKGKCFEQGQMVESSFAHKAWKFICGKEVFYAKICEL